MPEDKKKKLAREDAWKREHVSSIGLRLNHNTDRDILEYLDSLPPGQSKMGTIKLAIREHMAKK